MKVFKTAHDDVFIWLGILIGLLALAGWQNAPGTGSTPTSLSAPAPASPPASPSSSVSSSAGTPAASAPRLAAPSSAHLPTPALTAKAASARRAVRHAVHQAVQQAVAHAPARPAVPKLTLHFHGSDNWHSRLSGALASARERVDGLTVPTSTPQPLLPVPYGSRFLDLPVKASSCTAKNALPDHDCTPGVVFANVSEAQVCAPGYSASVRYVTTAEKNAVYAAYGIGPHPVGQYQIDHLVPLELGGSNDFANLWPQSQAWPGYRQKDVVENDLRRAVCLGQMPLAAAQERIAAFWKQTDWPLASD